jgi:hypothetical protein
VLEIDADEVGACEPAWASADAALLAQRALRAKPAVNLLSSFREGGSPTAVPLIQRRWRVSHASASPHFLHPRE